MTISCLSVTQRSRITFFEKALFSFERQSFKASDRELIIVHQDGEEFTEQLKEMLNKYSISNFLIAGSSSPVRLGELRNISVTKATGDLLCQWDDDDFYHKDRLLVQSEPFRDVNIIATTLALQIFWFPHLKELYIRKGGKEGTHGSIMFRKGILGAYDAGLDKGEDTAFIYDLLKSYPGRIHRIDNRPELYVRTVHGSNTWGVDHHRSQIAQALDRSWLQEREPEIREWLNEHGIVDVNVCDRSEIIFSVHT